MAVINAPFGAPTSLLALYLSVLIDIHLHADTVRRMTTGLPFEIDRLHHVLLAIPAGGEQQCRHFWGEVLGLIEIEKPSELAARGGCWFRGRGLEIHLGVEREFSPARKAHPAILVTNLAAFADHLQDHGIPVTWDDNFPGFHRFYADDPFSNRIEFLQTR